MKDHSTMSTFEYLTNIAWNHFIGFIWYKALLFRCLPHKSAYDSLQALAVFMVISVVLFLLLYRHWKNGWTALASFSIPFGAYTVATYSTTSKTMIMVSITIALVLSVAYAILLLSAKVKNPDRSARMRIYRRRISRYTYSVTCIVSTVMVLLMVGISWNALFGTALISSSVKADTMAESESQYTMASNMDTVLKLRPEVWAQQTTQFREIIFHLTL